MSEKAFASAYSAAEFLEKEILPKTSEEDAKNVKDKIRELRIDADDFHTWSWL